MTKVRQEGRKPGGKVAGPGGQRTWHSKETSIPDVASTSPPPALNIPKVQLGQRTELADYLGCPEEATASAWEACAAEPNPADWGAAEDWLDVEFIAPCPDGRAV